MPQILEHDPVAVQLATEINQIHAAFQTVQPGSTVYRVLESDLELLLTRYHKHTGEFFFVGRRSEVKKNVRM